MEFYPEVTRRWLASLVFGMAALATLAVAAFDRSAASMPGGYALLLGVISFMGILLGVLSIVAREAKRNMAYLGILMCAAPWIIGAVMTAIRAK